jgi:hypothetical protein
MESQLAGILKQFDGKPEELKAFVHKLVFVLQKQYSALLLQGYAQDSKNAAIEATKALEDVLNTHLIQAKTP